MKYLIAVVCMVGLSLIFVLCPLNTSENVEYLRIHIRANSNSQEDQTVKYLVKDGVVNALIPLLSEVNTLQDAKKIVNENFTLIENVANSILHEEGFTYESKASMQREYFPTRAYDNLILEEGEYDAVVLNLGSGEGNNWWCLVYPAFCFTSSTNSDNVVYISKIWEIIKNITREE